MWAPTRVAIDGDDVFVAENAVRTATYFDALQGINIQYITPQPIQIFGPTNFQTPIWRHRRASDGTWSKSSSKQFDGVIALDANGGRVAAVSLNTQAEAVLGAYTTVYVAVVTPGPGDDWSTATKQVLTPTMHVGASIADHRAFSVALSGDDLVLVHTAGIPSGATLEQVEIWRDQGTGTFTLVQTIPLTGQLHNSFTWGCDVQGDRLAFQSANPTRIQVWERTPPSTGTWSHVVDLPTPDWNTNLELSSDRLVAVGPTATNTTSWVRDPNGTWQIEHTFAPTAGQTAPFSKTSLSGATMVASGTQHGYPISGAPTSNATVPGQFDIFTLDTFKSFDDDVSLSTLNRQRLLLNPGEEFAGDLYAILGSATGTSPALAIPGSVLTLPLVPDAYLDFTLATLAGGGRVVPAMGTISATGRAQAQFRLPPGLSPAFVGLDVHHAYLLFDVHQLGVPLVHVSNAVTAHIVP